MTTRGIDKAIILAAGMGKRIAAAPGGSSPVGDHEARQNPKPLLPLDDSGQLTFLDWHLRSLAAHGAKEIFIVGNKVTFGTKLTSMDRIPATWVMNEFPGDVSGSGHSTHLAFTSEHDILDGKSRVVLMDADIVYDPSLYADLVRGSSTRSKTLVCGRFRETDEEVMVFGDDRGVPRLHGKGLLHTPMAKELKCLGEATGILLLEPSDHATWLGAAAWCMKFSTAKTRSEHEDITQRVMSMGALDAVVFDDDTRCMECDTPDEYAVVRRDMVPRWISKLPR
jgi:choline kinase